MSRIHLACLLSCFSLDLDVQKAFYDALPHTYVRRIIYQQCCFIQSIAAATSRFIAEQCMMEASRNKITTGEKNM